MMSATYLRQLGVLLAIGTSGVGCTGDAVTVGEQSSQEALYPKSLECVPGDPYEPQVDWEGYVEASTSELAAQRVRIREPQGNTPGFVLFGSGPLLPEATDPNAGWPCPDMSGDLLLPGFPYTIDHEFITDFRMQFRIAAFEPMESWCALHADSASQPGTPAGCEPPSDGIPPNQIAYGLCGYCTCDSAGCRAKIVDEPLTAYGDGIYYTFDIGVDGDRADGFVKNILPDISGSIGTNLQHARFQQVQ